MRKLFTISLMLFSNYAFSVTTLTNTTQQLGLNFNLNKELVKESIKETSTTVSKNVYGLTYNKLNYSLLQPDKNGFHLDKLTTSPSGWEKQNGETLQGLADTYNSTMTGINASYQIGRFSAETGFLNDISNESDGGKFYLRGSFIVLSSDKFNLSITAKVEALDDDLVDYYYGTKNREIYTSDSSTNATLGVIGTYSLNHQWKIIGAVSSTTLGDEIAESPLIEDNNYNMALIGTTYSF